MQFHPTTLKANGVLITEGCRGEGGYLRNGEGDRFMFNYAPERRRARLARRRLALGADRDRRGPRRRRLRAARPHPPRARKRINERLHGSRELAMDYAGVDPIEEPIPVRPGAHYHMGGIDTDMLGPHDHARPVRRRRVRLRLGARRQPAGRQLAARDGRVRPPLRRRRRPGRARQRLRRRVLAVRGARHRAPHLQRCSTASTASARTCCATSWPTRCTRTPASSAPPRSSSSAKADDRRACASATPAACVVHDKGARSTPT